MTSFCGSDNDENDYEQGIREERARIVAWLRSQPSGDVMLDLAADSLADDIEAGEHETEALGVHP